MPLKAMDSERKTLLIVDDSPIILKVEGTFLKREGYEVISASDGQEALQYILDRRPSVLITDIHMPGLNGIELCRLVRSKGWNDIPVLIVAGDCSQEEMGECLDAGADAFLSKPFDRETFLRKVADLLGVSERRYPRVRAEAEAECTVGEEVREGRVKNLSDGGMFLLVSPLPAVDSVIEISFSLPGGEGKPLRLKGRVVRSERELGGVGIEWVEPEEDALSAIRDYVDSHLTY